LINCVASCKLTRQATRRQPGRLAKLKFSARKTVDPPTTTTTATKRQLTRLTPSHACFMCVQEKKRERYIVHTHTHTQLHRKSHFIFAYEMYLRSAKHNNKHCKYFLCSCYSFSSFTATHTHTYMDTIIFLTRFVCFFFLFFISDVTFYYNTIHYSIAFCFRMHFTLLPLSHPLSLSLSLLFYLFRLVCVTVKYLEDLNWIWFEKCNKFYTNVWHQQS